jgi:hypothetical protein
LADDASDDSKVLKRKAQNLGIETQKKEITHASKEMLKAQSRAVSTLKPGGKDLRPGEKDAKPGGRDSAVLKTSETERNRAKEVAEPHSLKRLKRGGKQ